MGEDYNSLFSFYQGDLVAGGNPQCGDIGGTRFLGLLMGQNQHALVAFDTMFKCLEREGSTVARVIELGTGVGGMSIYLQLYCTITGASFVTYDLPGKTPVYTELFRRLGIDSRPRDILGDKSATYEISELIRDEGVSVLLCDNGDKPREFCSFAPALKPGDIILAHDYAPSPEYFEQQMHNRTWSFRYITESDIASACQEHDLVPYLEQEFLRAAWECRRKAA